MALEVYAKYRQNGQTVVAVKEVDPSFNVRFDAVLDGDVTGKTDHELIQLSLEWFINKYAQEYIVQQNTTRLASVEEELTKRSEQLASLINEAASIKTRLEEQAKANEIATASLGEMSLLFLNEGLLTLDDDGEMVLHPSIKQMIETQGVSEDA